MKQLLFTTLLLCGLTAAAQQHIDITQRWDSTRVLLNPDKGWYLHYMDNGVKEYGLESEAELDTFPGMHHLLVRIAWAYLEPKEGQFNWQTIDTIVARYAPKGYKLSLDITCKETTGKPTPYATPQWVEKDGAKGQIVGTWGTNNWEPDYNDPVFLAKWTAFQRAMAARYDGAEWLQDVTTGSIGDWGEGHSAHNVRAGVVIKHLNILLAYWKHTQINIGDDYLRAGKTPEETLLLRKFVKAHHIGYRDDSIFWEGVMHFPGSVQNPSFFEDVWRTTPTTLEFCHYNYCKQNHYWTVPDGRVHGMDTARAAIRIAHATFVGFHGHARVWQKENPHAAWDLINEMGYWLFPQWMEARLGNEGQLNISMAWCNKGVAPAYYPYLLQFTFIGADGVRHALPPVDAGNKNWLPGSTDAYYTFYDRGQLPPGRYLVEKKLYKRYRDGHEQPIRLGLKTVYELSDGSYRLGSLNL
jgi:hypothetical protein